MTLKLHTLKWRRLAALSLTMLAGVVGCNVDEKFDDCPPPNAAVHLALAVDTRASRATLSDFEIDNWRVYVFDKASNYITQVYCGSGYEVDFVLPSGDYNFVVWTNEGGLYKTTPAVSMNEMEMRLQLGESAFLTPIPDLLYGAAMNRTVVKESINNVLIELIPNTYRVDVKAHWNQQIAGTVETSITNDRSQYTFTNDDVDGEPQYRHLRVDKGSDKEGEVNNMFRVLRLSRDRHPQLRVNIDSSDVPVYERSLVRTIIEAYTQNRQTVDFATMFHFDVELKFTQPEEGRVEVVITVNGWSYKYSPTDLGEA